MKNRIKELAKAYAPELIAVRHHLHSHPELSFQEYNTTAFIQQKLKEYGVNFKAGIAGTGIIALIEGKNPSSKTIALRADIDALPITEANNVPYKSTNEGVMHACGHDVHTSCVLGAVKILNELKDELEGTIKVLFQPGEEKHPGGASIMIAEGALENPKPDAILGLHVHPSLEVGKLGFHAGKYMASADEIYITVKGKGGHAAQPHLTVDTILVASQLVVSLQQIISRNNNPFSPSVLSICAFNGGFTTNVIPSEVKLMGTFRAMDETWRFKAHELIRKQAIGIAEAMGAEIDVEILVGYPVLDNNEAVTNKAIELATEYLGPENVGDTEIRMGAEDFAFYSQVIPACFFRLGTGNAAKGITSGVHTPTFDVDERAIEIGMGTMAYLATRF
ncbi:hippurate hydrolase [Chitinophaga terrae (ex Kim and Jung 2007)]|uniref:Hippurate hydrolase n=1 Tax=Chitinophaga terrae (ex Kim and Jung 2007) TaxID=408074 RepID=A0A1H4CVR1_9BACT|nr:M20 family metallopeptidase [Chitinophaga terrae (ex Kim and Jung 2007)]MDQ0105310.1 hippurate hydrolase [Chitinophaga terrae (ex Kim and Jung 2007)]GEP90492.1 amidohydrolase [Chitinophaga terrae (ex Kim and Jung 2007)]SEA64202.1 hippurate hydrolase [Chitinophaga terrae (ex Kim and Jung 2007)]